MRMVAEQAAHQRKYMLRHVRNVMHRVRGYLDKHAYYGFTHRPMTYERLPCGVYRLVRVDARIFKLHANKPSPRFKLKPFANERMALWFTTERRVPRYDGPLPLRLDGGVS